MLFPACPPPAAPPGQPSFLGDCIRRRPVRPRYVASPQTGRRVSRRGLPADRVVAEAPERRLGDDAPGQTVMECNGALTQSRATVMEAARAAETNCPSGTHRPRRLPSGLPERGVRAGPCAMRGRDRHRGSGPIVNGSGSRGRGIRLAVIEARVRRRREERLADALAHPLSTLRALAPTSSPLQPQRFIPTATAPPPESSRIASSSQAFRLRNNPGKCLGGLTGESGKQHPPARNGVRCTPRARATPTLSSSGREPERRTPGPALPRGECSPWWLH